MCYYRVKRKRLLINRRGNDLTAASVASANLANIAKSYLILLYTCQTVAAAVLLPFFLHYLPPPPSTLVCT